MELQDPLAWYIAGPILGLFVPLFLALTGRELGISSSFRHGCSALLPAMARKKIPYLDYDWKREGGWQLVFVLGLVAGGLLATTVLGGAGISLLPENAGTLEGSLTLVFGGVLVGFGTRWADGCTSGHTINGIAQLQPASIVASACFVIGGVATSIIDRALFGGIIP